MEQQREVKKMVVIRTLAHSALALVDARRLTRGKSVCKEKMYQKKGKSHKLQGEKFVSLLARKKKKNCQKNTGQSGKQVKRFQLDTLD